ncbi:hypothetical protein J7E78_15950 [Paenibacillus polymyxa]|uniref:hypothetical protein n=1 Tax=Paenibacillus polymyxa TaxID=1406 RepID=UPI001BE7E357|nr:hypothetical protein [Paenibacillus polymyxa]MBT2285034.1 hypothetical protein [Paenibacillus polymyxa]
MTYKSSILVMLIVLLVGGGLFAYFYKFPKEVNVTREAVTYAQVDPETTESTAIKVEGTIYRPLFRQSTFEGRITIEGKDFTTTGDMMTVYVAESHGGIHMGNLHYLKSGKPLETLWHGLIWFDSAWENINLNLGRAGQTSDQNFYVVATARNQQEAYEVQARMSERFGDGFAPRNNIE